MITDTAILQAPFTPSYEKYTKLIRLEAYPEAESAAKELFDAAAGRLQPKGIYTTAYITRREKVDADTILHVETVSGQTFTFRGKVLAQLDTVHRVFPYIATCGNEMETFDSASLDMLGPFWLDTIKMTALGTARLHIAETLKKQSGIQKLSSVNPGSGNVDIWPIDQLGGIFSMLNEGIPVGVELNPSSLMIPNKTVSGLFFESESSFSSCRYCEREHCPGRKEPFGGTRL